MRSRYLYLDIVRIVACFLVVVMHSMRGGENANAVIYATLTIFAAPCNALFFMTSGALILPVKSEGGAFLKKRLGKIIVPCLFWTLMYNLVLLLFGERSIPEMLSLFVYIPFCDKAYGIMWFVYVLVGLYMLAPIISPWLVAAKKRGIEIVLAVWFVTLVLLIVRNFMHILSDERQMFYYFGGYAGYFVLGYYLHTYRPKIKVWIAICFILLSFLVGGLLRVEPFLGMDRKSVLGYLSLFIALSSIGWFSLIQTVAPRISQSVRKILSQKSFMTNKTRKFVIVVSNLTFGVYLTHFITCHTLWHIPFIVNNGCVAEILLTVILTFTLSMLLAWGLSRLPLASYLIGYKRTINHKDEK